MMTTLNAIREHGPCADGWQKLLRHLGKTQADDEPLAIVTVLDSNGLDDALWCLRAVTGHDREIRLYAVWCARQVQHLMTDPRSLAALDVAERYAHGLATDEELAAARDAAGAAAWDAAGDAAGVAAWDAARAAAGDAAGAAARAAARDAAGAAARAAAWVAAWAAAGAAAWAAQSKRLREVCAEICADTLKAREAEPETCKPALQVERTDPRRPLTDEEIKLIVNKSVEGVTVSESVTFRAVARAIERAHKIGGAQ